MQISILNVFTIALAFTVISGCNGKPVDQDKENAEAKKIFDHPDFDYDEDSVGTVLMDKKAEPKYNPEDAKIFQLANEEDRTKAIAYCNKGLSKMPSALEKKDIKEICQKISLEKSCFSQNQTPIFHYDRKGYSGRGKRILTISLVHGDEHASGTVATHWMKRLDGLNPRNAWRVVPILNPDGWANKSRVNANKVDINRNFPSKDWDQLALEWWKTKKKSDPRRYPGPSASSEPETKCLIKHINEFKPDFIIAVHTPLGVLDFDGPTLKAPHQPPLPWQRLGNFPGSLGRYMWVDHNVPVLTIELKGSDGIDKLTQFDRLQDISGTVAIQAGRILKKSEKKN